MDYKQQYDVKRDEIATQRLLSVSSVAHRVKLCGFSATPLTARAWIDLRLADNGVLNGICTYNAVRQYVVRNHIKYPLSDFGKAWVEAKLRTVSIDKAAEDCYRHLEQAFTEMPESVSDGTLSLVDKLPEVEGIVSVVDELAASYGCLPNEIIDLPLSQIFQYLKASRLRQFPDYKISEPKPLRDLKSKYLETLNNG